MERDKRLALCAASAVAAAATFGYLYSVRKRYHRWWDQGTLDSKPVVRVGVLGAAAIAKKNVRAMTLTSNVRCVALASRTLGKAQAFIDELHGAGVDVAGIKAVEGYDALLADPSIDAVYIPLPTSMHVEWVEKAVAKKKHVLCEKPIALSKADASRIISSCERAGLQFMDGTMFVHNPRQAMLKAAVKEPRFGSMRRIVSSFSFPGNDDFHAENIRVKKDCDALGALGDLGWYNVRSALELVDYRRPAYVQGNPGAARTADGVLTDCGVTLVWDDGFSTTFTCSFRDAWQQWLLAVGSKGEVSLDDFVITDARNGPRCEFRVAADSGLSNYDCEVRAGSREVRYAPVPLPPESLMWTEFGRCVRAIRDDGARPVASWPARCLLTQEIILAAQESLDGGCKKVSCK